jgi:hypothetical protein
MPVWRRVLDSVGDEGVVDSLVTWPLAVLI